MKHQIYKNLARLNSLASEDAERAFLDCCGSVAWARRLAAERPFSMLEDLFAKAENIWFSLPKADQLEAFAAERPLRPEDAGGSFTADPGRPSKARATPFDDPRAMSELAEASSLYKEKFGFIFIVMTSGKTAGELLAICRARLRNSVETELHIAAEEQRKITESRLEELLEK